MKEYLRHLKNENFDGLNFIRNTDGDLEISGFTYKNPGEKEPGSVMGDMYEIIIFPEDPPKTPERFKAILSSPLDYISRMIDDGFLGIVAKATTTSGVFMDNMEQSLMKYFELYKEIYDECDDE